MILRKMIEDPPGSSRLVRFLKYWGGLLILTCGTILLCAVDYLVLCIKTSIYHIRQGDAGYKGLPDVVFGIGLGVVLLLSLYQLFLFKWNRTFLSIYWRCVFIVIQIIIGGAIFLFIGFDYTIYIAGYDSI